MDAVDVTDAIGTGTSGDDEDIIAAPQSDYSKLVTRDSISYLSAFSASSNEVSDFAVMTSPTLRAVN